MRKKSFKLTKEPSSILETKKAIITKLAAQILLLTFLIGLIIYSLP